MTEWSGTGLLRREQLGSDLSAASTMRYAAPMDDFEDPRAWAIRVLDEVRAKIADSDVELVIFVAPLLEKLQQVARLPGIGPADEGDDFTAA